MIVPYQSYLDPFVKNIIEGYSFKPDKIEFVGPGKWDNVGDKINDKFHENKDAEFLIFHRAASIINYDDLEFMLNWIKKEPNCLHIGIEPAMCYPGIRAPTMADNPKKYHSLGGVVIWRAKLYFKIIDEVIELCKKEKSSLIELFTKIGEMGLKKGYDNIQDTHARIVYYD